MEWDKRRDKQAESIEREDDEQKEGGGDKRKQSLYFPDWMLEEIKNEALRQDRSLSWIIQQAWKIAKPTIQQFPSPSDVINSSPFLKIPDEK